MYEEDSTQGSPVCPGSAEDKRCGVIVANDEEHFNPSMPTSPEYTPSFEELHPSAQISQICAQLMGFLQEKNIRYGNSALEPVRVFSKLPADEQLKIRMDDKVSRIINSDELRKNDVVDLMGYMVLICIKNGWDNFDELLD